MQQHTGQHILSRSFLKLYNLQTVGFHLGKDFSTIDLDASQMSLDKLYEGETYANKVIFENRPVYIRYFNEEEIEKIKLRKDLDCSGLYRIIEIKDFDLSACGGTHCNTTGEVGLIVIKGWEKLKDKFRIEFLCGLRVLKTFREYNAIFKEISWRFSVGLQDVISKMDKLTNESNENYKALKKFKEQCLNQEVELLYQNEEKNKQGITHIRRSYDDKTFEELKSLAKNVIMKFEKTIVCFATTSEPASIVIARSKDLNFNLSLFMKGFNKDFSGKGGGQPDFVQGGGYKVQDVENIFERIQESVLNCKKEDCKS